MEQKTSQKGQRAESADDSIDAWKMKMLLKSVIVCWVVYWEGKMHCMLKLKMFLLLNVMKFMFCKPV